MRRVMALVLLWACSSETEDTRPTPVSEHSGDEQVEVLLVGEIDEQQHQQLRDSEDAERTSQRDAFTTECANVQLLGGLPPGPPPTPSVGALQALEPTYRASLVAAPTPPSTSLNAYNQWASSTLAAWIREATTKTRDLQQGVSALDPAHMPVGMLWLAQSYGYLVAALEGLPIPHEIENDPELRRVFREALRSHMRPLLAQARALLDHPRLHPPSGWETYPGDLREWVTQQECAIHPGR